MYMQNIILSSVSEISDFFLWNLRFILQPFGREERTVSEKRIFKNKLKNITTYSAAYHI